MPTLSSHADDEARWARLMAAANSGDKSSYQVLLKELGDVLEAYIRLRFGSLLLLEDCVQECLIAIHNARTTYDSSRPFRPWMFTIARHKTIDVLRKSGREPNIDTRVSDTESSSTDGEAVSQRLDGVRLLESLSAEHRDAIALTQYAGYTVPEAAQRLGISTSALKARLRRGLLAIKHELEREDLP